MTHMVPRQARLEARVKGEFVAILDSLGVSVALCGGLGSVSGALIAACILGLVEALTTAYLGGQYVLITQFIVIIIILLIRPRGIAGMLDKAREA